VLLHVQTAVVAVDDHGRVGVYNRAAQRVLGAPADDVLGHTLDELTDAPAALAALVAVLQQARRSGRAATRREVRAHTERGERVLGYTLSVLAHGALALFFADITDALAEERRASEAQRFAEVGKIASAMAHELKSPLATVELYANLLRRRLGKQPEAVEQLDVIKDQTRLCLERISAIMHSINPDAAAAAGMVLTPLVPVVRRVVETQRRRFSDAAVHLRAGSCSALVPLPENDLRSVVGNLVVNALQVTGGKGPVDVSVTADEERVRLRVADGGPGLPEADVFAAFFTTRSSGTGLGLWLVRRLVEQAGGTIAARQRRGGGAVFTVDLPLPRRERLRGARVLIVEDDADLRAATSAVLCAQGAAVTAVNSGAEVPNGGRRWDCGVLDYHLPDMTGTQIAARLPEGMPVLFVSGDPAAGPAVAGVRDRRAWYLPKPFEADTYVDLVSLLVGSA
jgi:PAS domain S-box-containing protein